MNFPWPKSVSIRRVLYLRRCAGNRSKHRYGAFARNIFYSSPNCRARPYGIGLKEYGVLLFCKGALINDANGILFKPGENMRAARQIRFTNVRGKVELETILKSYTYEAVEAEKAGWKVFLKR